jgi:ppGpp synthetase/RelA/SpoT-type nucleotidyltranferase
MPEPAGNGAAGNDAAAWVAQHVERYAKVYRDYQLYAEVLAKVLQAAAGKLAPLAIVQARPKSIPGFAEKIIRKRRLYKDPLADMTDLCGARVIVHTAEQVHALSRFIEEHLTIDWDNSADVSQRLRPTEFGYRSVHYIVSFKPGELSGPGIPLEIPAVLWQGKDPAGRALKAEIQVRTILEHAWADISHDMAYKSGFKVPARILRQFAAVAAVLEGTDREFARIHDGLQAYASEYGKYLQPAEIQAEIQQLDLVLGYDRANAGLATRIATLAMAVGNWQKAVDVLEPYRSSDCQPARRTLGVALCKLSDSRGDREGFLSGRRLLEEATRPPLKDPDGLCALADAWRTDDRQQARKFYRQAFELDPTHPTCLANYLEHEIACQRNNAVISLFGPTIAAACRRCRNQIEGEVDLPWAYLHLAKFHLLLGQPHEGLAALAKAIQRCPAPFLLQSARESLIRIGAIAGDLPGYAWLWKLLLLGQAVKYPQDLPAALPAVRDLATADRAAIRGPVVIVAGGCDRSVQQQMQTYRPLLDEAFQDFTGTILCGGTTQGIAGLVGDIRRRHGARLHTIGYIPSSWPADATPDEDRDRYDEIRPTDGSGFSPLEPLQNWIDLVSAGIAPAEVKLLGINGGTIAAAEYRIAAALGARVALLEKSGREAAKVFADPDWEGSPNLVGIPADAMTLRAFVGHGKSKMPRELCEVISQGIHEAYRRNKTQPSADPSMADWARLPETLKNSNREQANHIFDKLREIGLSVKPAENGKAEPFEFAAAELERLAEMEHGRWNAERLLDGWRFGETKDVAGKISPYLVPWAILPDEVKKWDRLAVKEIPVLLAKVGMQICRS